MSSELQMAQAYRRLVSDKDWSDRYPAMASEFEEEALRCEQRHAFYVAGKCSSGFNHESLKRSPEWHLLDLVGFQKAPPGKLELRNCRCGSTIAVRLS